MRAFTVMAEVLACLCEQLDATPAGRPCFCGFTTGVQAYPVDACLCGQQGDHCGTAWVRLDSVFPSATFPLPDTNPQAACTSPLAYRINVGVVRCQPGLGAQGKPPNAGAWDLAAQRLVDDAAAAYRAVQCCSVWNRGDAYLGVWVPLGGPDGQCAGGHWAFTFRDLS